MEWPYCRLAVDSVKLGLEEIRRSGKFIVKHIGSEWSAAELAET